jgi:coenzyme F420-0:L-glutamate ligase/coenzyme F420-1:gamma-L-glutamate ligase
MPNTINKVSIIPLPNLPLIRRGDDLVNIIIRCLSDSGEELLKGDILVLSQKIVSKAEGNTVDLNEVAPSKEALELAQEVGKDPRLVHLILKESKRIVRKSYGVLIMEHKKGWICADAGVDFSNVAGNCVALLPEEPDRTAENIRDRLRQSLHVEIAILISDSQGRPFRNGSVGVALGCAGMPALVSLIGDEDLYHYKLRHAQAAFADQVASSALLVMGEANEGVPAVIVRGLNFSRKKEPARDLIRSQEKDLFR